VTGAELQAFDALPVPAMVMDDRRILAANRRMADLAAVPLPELLAVATPARKPRRSSSTPPQPASAAINAADRYLTLILAAVARQSYGPYTVA
jgi:hypothetical protein